MACLFGICFIGHTGPITNEVFAVVDPTHWVLSVGDKFQDLTTVRDVCMFLTNPAMLSPDQALSLYIKSGNDWSYRGHVSAMRVSEVFPLQNWAKAIILGQSCCPKTVLLQKKTFRTAKSMRSASSIFVYETICAVQWSEQALRTRDAQIGICLEPLTEVACREESIVGSKANFAKRVAMNLYTFMGSFGTTQSGDRLIVPANVFERWYTRFQEKFKRDPDFLTREDTVI